MSAQSTAPAEPRVIHELDGKRVLVIGSFDSFLKAAMRYASALREARAQIQYVIARVRNGQLSQRQLLELDLPVDTPVQTIHELCDRAFLDQFDVILLALDGNRTRKFMVGFQKMCTGIRRPITVCFYPGVVFRFGHEGLVSRMSCDLLLLNSEHDYREYRLLQNSLGVEHDNGFPAGLAVVRSETSMELEARRVVLFIGQPTVPSGPHEREYIVERLIGLAQNYSEYHFIIKPRHRPDEQTLHRVRYPYADILRHLSKKHSGNIPSNLGISYEPLDQLISRCRLCLSVSSTAVLECANLGIPARVITDLGIHENLGTNFFVGSGLLTSFDDVHPGLPAILDPSWAEQHAQPAAENHHQVVHRITALLAEQGNRSTALPLPGGTLFGLSHSYIRFINQNYGPQLLAQFGDPFVGKWWRWQSRMQKLRRFFSRRS